MAISLLYLLLKQLKYRLGFLMKVCRKYLGSFLILMLLPASQQASAALITQLFSPDLLTLSNNFDTSFRASNADVTFAAPYVVNSSASGVDDVNPSGLRGVFVDKPLPLVGELTAPNYAMGMWFGNDDYNMIFDAILEVFSGTQSLGIVEVVSNANDWADQFIGLSSNMAFDRFELTYQRPQAGNLGIWIDDLYLSKSAVSVPVPATALLFLFGFACLLLNYRRNNSK